MTEISHRSALDAVPNTLERITSNDASLPDVFFPAFVETHTECETITSFFEMGSWNVETTEDLESIDVQELDEHVGAHSSFDTWEEMAEAATNEFIHRSSRY